MQKLFYILNTITLKKKKKRQIIHKYSLFEILRKKCKKSGQLGFEPRSQGTAKHLTIASSC